MKMKRSIAVVVALAMSINVFGVAAFAQELSVETTVTTEQQTLKNAQESASEVTLPEETPEEAPAEPTQAEAYGADAPVCGVCGEAHEDAACPVAAVSALLDGLPTPDDLRAMDAEAFDAAGAAIYEAYDKYAEQYAALSEAQQEKIPDADTAFTPLFEVLNEGVTNYDTVNSGNITDLTQIGSMAGSYTLTADTTYSADTPVGCAITPATLGIFTGTLDGGGHTITVTSSPTFYYNDLTGYNDGHYSSLFARADQATFKNINIVVKGGFSYQDIQLKDAPSTSSFWLGALVGRDRVSTFENCTVTVASGTTMAASVNYSSDNGSSAQLKMGGLIGETLGSKLKHCSFNGALSGTAAHTNEKNAGVYLGGLGGKIIDQTPSLALNCSSTGTITGQGMDTCIVGGIFGGIEEDYYYVTQIKNCYSLATVSATANAVDSSSKAVCAGGLIGRFSRNSEIDNCYFGGTAPTTTVTNTAAETNLAGMLMAWDKRKKGTITNCWYADGGTPFGETTDRYEASSFTDKTALCEELNSVAENNVTQGYYMWKQTMDAYPDFIVPVLHEHNEKTFTEWTNANSLPIETGNYYLPNDVVLPSTWYPEGTVNLCLNGHKISYDNKFTAAIDPKDGCTLNIWDCTDGGEISCTGGNVIIFNKNASVTLHGGTLIAKAGNDGVTRNTVVDNKTNSTFTLEGGTVRTEGTTAPAIVAQTMTVKLNGGTVNSTNADGVYTRGGTINLGGTVIRHGGGFDSIKTTVANKINASSYTGDPLTVLWAATSATAGTVVVTGVDDTTAAKFTLSDKNTGLKLERSGTTLVLASTNFAATVNLHKDGAAWASSGVVLTLRQGGNTKYTPTESGGTFTASDIPSGTYDVYAGDADTGVDVSDATAVTVDYYTVTYNRGSGTGTPPATATVLKDSTYTMDKTLPLTRTGYTQAGWNTTSETTVVDSTPATSTTITAKTTLYPVWKLTAPTATVTATYGGSTAGDSVSYNGGNLVYTANVTHPLSGSVTYGYQWYQANGTTPIDGATGSSYTVTTPELDTYKYICKVSYWTVEKPATPPTVTASKSVTVGKATVAVPAIPAKTYNGAPQTAAVTETADYTVTNIGGTDAGTYDVVLTLKDTVHKQWAGGEAGEITKTFTIKPITLTWDASGLAAQKPYDGTAAATVTGTLKVSGTLAGEDAKFTYTGLTGTYADKEPGTGKTVTVQATGAKVGNANYALPSTAITITGRISPLLPEPAQPTKPNEKLKLTVEEGIPTVPAALQSKPELNTAQKIEAALKTEAIAQLPAVSAANIVTKDIELWFSNDSGVTWTEATADKFPTAGITVVVPYTELRLDYSTAQGMEFTVLHMISAGDKAGTIETPDYTLMPDGVQFVLHSLSPVTIAYKQKSNGTAPTNPGTGGTGSTGGTGGSVAASPAASVSPSGSGSAAAPGKYTVNAWVNVLAGGVVSPMGSTAYTEGQTLTYTITPAPGYRIAKVTVDGVDIGAVSSYTFKGLNRNHEIGAYFEKATGILGGVIPTTGDEAPLMLWAALMALAGIGLGASVLLRRKKQK